MVSAHAPNIDRMVVGLDHSDLQLRLQGINALASEQRLRRGRDPSGRQRGGVRLRISAQQRCGWTHLLTPANQEAPIYETEPYAMVVAIARAFRWQEQIKSQQFASV